MIRRGDPAQALQRRLTGLAAAMGGIVLMTVAMLLLFPDDAERDLGLGVMFAAAVVILAALVVKWMIRSGRIIVNWRER